MPDPFAMTAFDWARSGWALFGEESPGGQPVHFQLLGIGQKHFHGGQPGSRVKRRHCVGSRETMTGLPAAAEPELADGLGHLPTRRRLPRSGAALGLEPGEQAPGSARRLSERLRLPLPSIRERRHALRERQQFPEPVACITPTGWRGPYLDPGTGPFEAPARRQLDASGLDIVGYPGQPGHRPLVITDMWLEACFPRSVPESTAPDQAIEHSLLLVA